MNIFPASVQFFSKINIGKEKNIISRIIFSHFPSLQHIAPPVSILKDETRNVLNWDRWSRKIYVYIFALDLLREGIKGIVIDFFLLHSHLIFNTISHLTARVFANILTNDNSMKEVLFTDDGTLIDNNAVVPFISFNQMGKRSISHWEVIDNGNETIAHLI